MSASLTIGPLASAPMMTGPHERRRALLDKVASSGLDHVFVADHVSFFTGLGMDGLIQAALVTALEPRIAVHIGVYLLALRHPVTVAREIATICESAPGRLVLGVGVGGEDRHEVEICGVDPRTRGRRTDASLVALRGLLSGEPTSACDDFFDFQEALIKPPPEPAVPIVIGGRSDAAIRRAGLHGDGWLGVWCSPRRYAQALAEVGRHADDAGRGDVQWQHGLQVWVGVGADRTKARERLAARMEGMYQIPFERFEPYSPHGSAQTVAEALAPYVEAGCSSFNVMAVGESAEAEVDAVAEVAERLRRG
jgi:alkanesulfonate monooxygenase SsuD/methylene tetrahydromethanopterin reductase-like flavin-dependent oxidoreductase (luciferase family)